MKIDRVELKNIRQFVGTQVIDFSMDARKNITLIHGPNTTGKTTLLNAIYWCLYGSFLPGFAEPDRLLSDHATEAEFSVEVEFSNENRHYFARRSSRTKPSDSKFTVNEKLSTGRLKPHPSPSMLVNSLLPEPLAPFFFFAGEMIKQGLGAGTSQHSAAAAIRSVLGFALAEQAIEDLKFILKRKRTELNALSAGTDLGRLNSELTEAEQLIETLQSQLEQQRVLIGQLEAQKTEQADKLRGLESTAALQTKRDRTSSLLDQALKRQVSANKTWRELVAEFGSSIYLREAAETALKHVDQAILKKRIPGPFDKTFVQDILSSEECICGRPVVKGTQEYKSVYSLVNTGTDAATIQRAMNVRSASTDVARKAAEVQKALNRATEQLTGAEGEVHRLEQELARISDLLKRNEDKDAAATERELIRVEKVLRELTSNRILTERDLEEKKKVVRSLRVEMDRATAASPQIEEVRQVVELITELIETLEAELATVEAAGLKKISKALNEVVQKSTRSKYEAVISSGYSIDLFKSDNSGQRRPVYVLSSGERRLLQLCFISALVSVCRDHEADANSIVLPGAIAPLIVDAPFGELDPEYQALAATTMMELSDQLVLMLSKTHWTERVDKALRSRIGREWLFVGHHVGIADKADNVETTIAGYTYQQMKFGSDKNWTELVSVRDAQ